MGVFSKLFGQKDVEKVVSRDEFIRRWCKKVIANTGGTTDPAVAEQLKKDFTERYNDLVKNLGSEKAAQQRLIERAGAPK